MVNYLPEKNETTMLEDEGRFFIYKIREMTKKYM
jgi:hypothetical protein